MHVQVIKMIFRYTSCLTLIKRAIILLFKIKDD